MKTRTHRYKPMYDSNLVYNKAHLYCDMIFNELNCRFKSYILEDKLIVDKI